MINKKITWSLLRILIPLFIIGFTIIYFTYNKPHKDFNKAPSQFTIESKKLIEVGVKCCMDISDGLNNDLSNLSESSKVSLEINVEEIPISKELKDSFPNNYIDIAINGGEDYELLFTFDESKIKLPFNHFVIGRVLEKNAKNIFLMDFRKRNLQVRGMLQESLRVFSD